MDEAEATLQAQVALDSFEEATWDAISHYRETGDLVPVVQDGAVRLLTVDEALRSRRDWEKRRDQVGRRKCANLLAQFRESGRPFPPDLWDRLAADRRAQLADELRWIDMARAAAEAEAAARTNH